MATVRAYSLLVGSIVVPLVVAIASCEKPTSGAKPDAPKYTTAWTGRRGNLAEWGHGRNYIYAGLGIPDSNEDLLVLWTWQNGLLKENSPSALPESRNLVPATQGVCGLSLRRHKGSWPYALLRLEDGNVLAEWEIPRGWWTRLAGGSLNGEYISFVVNDGTNAEGYVFQKPRIRVALIDVARRELHWAAELREGNPYNVRQVTVSDDGRYVAVGGWDHGTAVIDANEGKCLWAVRPDEEIGAGYVAFAADGNLIYVGGDSGCVYGHEVRTGKIVSRRWATSTGESIYGHRISVVAVSDNGKWLAAGIGPKGEVYVWNLRENGKARVLPHGGGTVLIVAFSPDSRDVATVGAGALKVWALERNETGSTTKPAATHAPATSSSRPSPTTTTPTAAASG